jgi:hypothetical protein
MELRTVIFTTSDGWIERDFAALYKAIRNTHKVDVLPFTVVKVQLPDTVPTYEDGGTYIAWDWIKQHYPADGHNAVCLHLSARERERLGLKHPDPNSSLGGCYHIDKDNVLDFVVIANKSSRAYNGMTGFERIFLHELSHGFAHWTGVTDYTHTWDYVLKDMRAAFTSYSFTLWTSLYNEVQRLMAHLATLTKLHPPLDAQWMRVSQPFGVPNSTYPLTKHHVGTDYAVPTGEPCYALADGRVTAVFSNHRTLGNACHFEFVHNGNEYTARYMHLARTPQIGSYKRGAIIGFTGSTGLSTNPHLHIDVVRGEFDLTGINKSNFRQKFVDITTLL